MEFDPRACSTLACNLPTQGGAPHGRLSQIQPDASHVPQRAGVATAAAVGMFLPVYLVVVLLAPSYKHWAKNHQLNAFVRGVTAARRPEPSREP